MGRFDDRASRPIRGFGDILKWKVLGRSPPPAGPPAPARPLEVDALSRPSLSWIGHATFLIRLGGQLIATDPIWTRRISGVISRMAELPVELNAVPPIDVVVVTHNHRDHLDVPTLQAIGRDTQFVVPVGDGALLKRSGLPNVTELDWWESFTQGALTVTMVPARHWSMRVPWNKNDALWGGYVLRGPEGVVYHAGDTALFDRADEIGERAGPIDYALLPIGAYEPRWFMHSQHMNPEDAVAVFEALGARTFVPMHWGTFRLTDEPLSEPRDVLKDLWAEHGLADDVLRFLDIGESLAIE